MLFARNASLTKKKKTQMYVGAANLATMMKKGNGQFCQEKIKMSQTEDFSVCVSLLRKQNITLSFRMGCE